MNWCQCYSISKIFKYIHETSRLIVNSNIESRNGDENDAGLSYYM